jgi:hypothetical protein
MTHSVPINRSLWSRSSQRSYGGNYDERATHYEGIAYRCRPCGSSSVWSAEAQRHAYEVEKKISSWVPNLCDACRSRRADLKKTNAELQERWCANRETLAVDLAFLESWLSVSRELVSVGVSYDSRVRQLAKLIADFPTSR